MTRLDLIRARHRAKLLEPYADAAAERAERKREIQRNARRRWEAKNRALGLCKSCTEPAVAGGRCERHRREQNEYNRAHMREVRARDDA